MSPDHTIRLLERILVASFASTQAYRRSAAAADSPGIAALFTEYGKDHARLASWVSRQIARVCRERQVDAPAQVPPASTDEPDSVSRDLHALLTQCAKLQDAVVAALADAKDSSLSAPARRFIARECEQLRWAREGLDRMSRERVSARPSPRSVIEQLRLLQSSSFEPDRFAGLDTAAR